MQVKRKRLRAGGPATRLGLGLTQASSVRIPALLRQTRRLCAFQTAAPALADLMKEPSERAPRAASEPTPPSAPQSTRRPRGHRPAPLLPPLPTLPSKRLERASASSSASAVPSTTAPSSPSTRYLPPGFRLAAYTILRRSNEGGTCEIYHVEHPKLSLRAIARVARRTVLEAHPWIRERMLTNAEIIAESNHSNLMRILDFGETGESAPRPFVITERIIGRDLAVYLARHGQVPVATVLDIGLQITRGLAELHRLGLSHGDLKPSNIMISLRTDGSLRIVLIDFDLARHQEAPRSPGLSPGTPNYLPPEHSIGMRPSIHFDIYALGVILHELLLGECPVDEQRCLTAIAEQSEWPMICPLHIEHPELGVPRSMSRLIARLTHRDRCRRPKSLVEVERAIERLLTPSPRPGARDNAALTLRPSVSAWVNVALAKNPPPAGHISPTAEKTRQNTAASPPIVQPAQGPELPRAILPLITDEPQDASATSSWHQGELLELLDQPTPDERASSPLRELRRGRLVTMLALGAIVSILSIIAGAARVVAMPDTPAAEPPQESVNNTVDELRPAPPREAITTRAVEAVEESSSAFVEPPMDGLLTPAEPADAHPPQPAHGTAPRRRSSSSAKAKSTTDRPGTSLPQASSSTTLLPVIRARDIEDETVADENTGAELGSEAESSPAPRPRASHRETPPVTVPKLTGMDLDDAKASLRRVGIGYRVRRAAAGECFFREGTIIAQSFAPGTAVAQNLEITMDYCRDEENEREEEKRHGHATDQRHNALEHQQSP